MSQWCGGGSQGQWQYGAGDQVVGWQYDQAGNLTDDTTQQYRYDALNRLTGVTTNGAGYPQTTMQYNGDGVLVSQMQHSSRTRFTQDLVAPLSQVLQTSNGSANTTYVYGLDRLASIRSGTWTWSVADALGSTRLMLDDAGRPQTTSSFDPWGQPTTGILPTPFGFTGEWQDTSTGLVNLRARWYQPQTGRFLGRDPFEGFDTYPASLQPYAYVGNNPTNLTDPSGQCYAPLEILRRVEATNCRNLDSAIRILQHPQASWMDKMTAGGYVVAWTVPHATVLAGAGIVAGATLGSAAGAAASVVEWATPYVVAGSAAGGMATVGGTVVGGARGLPQLPPDVLSKVGAVCTAIIGTLLAKLTLSQALPQARPRTNNRSPVLFVSRKVMPEIAGHIFDAQTKFGKPNVLTYRGAISAAAKRNIRKAAGCNEYWRKYVREDKLHGSCDEYPFASTVEGGTRSSIREVPDHEQDRQGTEIAAFVKVNKLQAGDKFQVVVTP